MGVAIMTIVKEQEYRCNETIDLEDFLKMTDAIQKTPENAKAVIIWNSGREETIYSDLNIGVS